MEKHEQSDEFVSKELVNKILKQFFRIYNDLGSGFLERVYQNALYFALIDEGLKCETEVPIKVYHNGRVVGDYKADILVDNCVILELKVCDEINSAHEAQLINYLRASEIEVGYLLNFGKNARFIRKVYSNNRKK